LDLKISLIAINMPDKKSNNKTVLRILENFIINLLVIS